MNGNIIQTPVQIIGLSFRNSDAIIEISTEDEISLKGKRLGWAVNFMSRFAVRINFSH